MKYKCWHDYPENVYDGDINSFQLDIQLDDKKETIIGINFVSTLMNMNYQILFKYKLTD